MFGTTSGSVDSSAGGVRLLAPNACTSLAAMPNASRVALMLCRMYSASLSRMLGLTSKVCTAHG